MTPSFENADRINLAFRTKCPGLKTLLNLSALFVRLKPHAPSGDANKGFFICLERLCRFQDLVLFSTVFHNSVPQWTIGTKSGTGYPRTFYCSSDSSLLIHAYSWHNRSKSGSSVAVLRTTSRIRAGEIQSKPEA